MKSAWAKWALALASLLVLLLAGAQASIEWGNRDFSQSAMKRFPGSRETALIELVACEKCSMTDRNRAVWALGQLREKRALPVLYKHRTGLECNHAIELCQHEINKALKRIMN